MDREQENKAAVDAVLRAINDMGFEPEPFVNEMKKAHRTLQQSFTVLCLAWLNHLAELKNHEFDLRNEWSVDIAKQLKERVPDAFGVRAPFI